MRSWMNHCRNARSGREAEEEGDGRICLSVRIGKENGYHFFQLGEEGRMITSIC